MCPDTERWAAAGERLVEAGKERIATLSSLVEEYADTGFLRS
ncbi:hypothetical protein [Nocardioides convexus]|nr:hypothetical protein [Nocardioides convexus]